MKDTVYIDNYKQNVTFTVFYAYFIVVNIVLHLDTSGHEYDASLAFSLKSQFWKKIFLRNIWQHDIFVRFFETLARINNDKKTVNCQSNVIGTRAESRVIVTKNRQKWWRVWFSFLNYYTLKFMKKKVTVCVARSVVSGTTLVRKDRVSSLVADASD